MQMSFFNFCCGSDGREDDADGLAGSNPKIIKQFMLRNNRIAAEGKRDPQARLVSTTTPAGRQRAATVMRWHSYDEEFGASRGGDMSPRGVPEDMYGPRPMRTPPPRRPWEAEGKEPRGGRKASDADDDDDTMLLVLGEEEFSVLGEKGDEDRTEAKGGRKEGEVAEEDDAERERLRTLRQRKRATTEYQRVSAIKVEDGGEPGSGGGGGTGEGKEREHKFVRTLSSPY